MSWPFGRLKRGSFDLLMVDAPWPMRMRSKKGEKKSAGAKYALMSFAEIAAMPVGELLKPHGVAFVWGVWPFVFHGGTAARRYRDADAAFSPIGAVIKAWGLRYVTGGAWHKRTVHGKTVFGPGYRVRSSCEPFFLALKGNPKTSRSERNLIEGIRREHSRKPEEAYAWCERYVGQGAQLAEIFSRTRRRGWSTWGREAGKFPVAA